jgi:MFS family permease
MGKKAGGPTSSVGAPARPAYKWLVVGMLWWIAFFNYADRQAIFSVFPLLEKEFHLSLAQLGLLGSSFAWAYGLCAPFAGNIVWSAICMATALARNFGGLLFFRASEGIGESLYFPGSVSLISDYHGGETRSRALGIHQTSVYIGTIAGGAFAGLIGQAYGWRWSFLVFGALGVALGLFLRRFLMEPARGAADLGGGRHAERIPTREFLRIVWGTPTVLLLMAAFLCANFVAVVLLSWMPKFLYDRFHLSLAAAGLTATVFVQLASMAGSPLGGWLADALRKRTPGGRLVVQAVGVFGGAPFVVLCALTASVKWLIVALIAWGFFKGLYDANIFASMFDVIRPEARGTAAGFMNMTGWLGGGMAPLAIGYIAQGRGLSFAIASAAAAYVAAGALLVAGVFGTVRRDASRMQAQLEGEAL